MWLRGRAFAAALQHTHLTLRERQGNTVLVEGVPQRQVDIAANIGQPAGGVFDPEAQDVIHATVPKADDVTDGGIGVVQNALDGFGRLNRHFAHQMWIIAIGRAEEDIEPHIAVGMRPVHHLIGDQVFIGNEELFAIARNHRDVARAQRIDPAKGLPQRNHVAGFDRFIHHNDQARDQIGDHLLQSKTEANANKPGEEGEPLEIKANDTQADKKGGSV
mmetsp:Transcript_3260/g.5663  ORF Transcript_3260/g.5663 Transcript_3260/m.5663 type:complete len:218 (+) Transcript_3260:21-674(+)